MSIVRSIVGEAGDRTDDDEAHVQSKFGDRLRDLDISFDTERVLLSIDGSIGNDIPTLLASLPPIGEAY